MKLFAYIIIMSLSCGLRLPAQEPFCVVIDAGHGGKDPGCVRGKVKEKTINLSVALKVGALIERSCKDVKIIYTRRSDVFIPLDERANIANRNKADLFISIHTNAAKRGNASGTETFTLGLANSDENLDVAMRENSVILMEDDYMQKYEGFDPKSTESYIIFEFMQNKHLAQSITMASEIQKSFALVGRGNRGVRQAGLLVLRRTSMPAVLVELGFMSNKDEERYMASEAGQDELSKSIFEAFTNFRYDYERKRGEASRTAEKVTADGKVAATSETTSQPSESLSAEAIRQTAAATLDIEDTTDSVTENRLSREEKGDRVPVETSPMASVSALSTSASASKSGTGGENVPTTNDEAIVYKVQLFTSDLLLKPDDKRFKGYSPISYYREHGVYKYTCGASSDYGAILKLQRKAAADFKGAFIIRTRGGERLKD